MKKLLILGGIKSECEIVLHAKKLGIYTIVADYDINSPAKKLCDKSVLINAIKPNDIIEFCNKEKVDGIITGYVDILLPCYLKATSALNLPCYLTSKMLSMSTDKLDFKTTCENFDIPVPKTYYVGGKLTEEIFDSIVYPVFVKPLDASGSRGCSVCENEYELKKNFNKALKFSNSKTVLIEEYLVGREFLLDYVGMNGNFYMIEMFDRFMAKDRISARNYSNVSLAPSFAIDSYYEKIDSKVRSMFKKLGFKDGLIFLQGVYDEHNNIKLYEMGCRLGGTFVDLEQECLGVNSIDMLINYALYGKMCDDISIFSNNVAKFDKYATVNNYLLKGDNHKIDMITGIDEIIKMPNVVRTIQHRDTGSFYGGENIVDKPLFSIYFTGKTLDEIKESILYQNSVFSAIDDKGESILMEKIKPDTIKC